MRVAGGVAIIAAVAIYAAIRIRADDVPAASPRVNVRVDQSRPGASPVTIPSAPVLPKSTSPAVRPVKPTADDTDALIQRLGTRDAPIAAQSLLDRGGPAVLEKLRTASQKDHNPEIRAQSSALAAEMLDRDAEGPTPIDVHVDRADPAAVWAALAVQGRCKIDGTKTTFADRRIDLHAAGENFWGAVTDVCAQTGVAPAIDSPPDHTLSLTASPRNWLADTPHQVVGPYWVGIVGIDRRRTIPLVPGAPAEDAFDVRLVLMAEPKLSVSAVSDFLIQSAADDLGNDLSPDPPPQALLDRPTNHMVIGHLRYPDRPGRTIKEASGKVVVLLAEGNQMFRIDDVLKKPTIVNPVAGCDISAAVAVKSPGVYAVKIVCDRQEMDEQRWRALRGGLDGVTMFDTDGKPLRRLLWDVSPGDSLIHFEATASFVQDRCGEPKTMGWEIASRFKMIEVPVTFRNLPMP